MKKESYFDKFNISKRTVVRFNCSYNFEEKRFEYKFMIDDSDEGLLLNLTRRAKTMIDIIDDLVVNINYLRYRKREITDSQHDRLILYIDLLTFLNGAIYE
ncbi:MAG: hypothetical protein ACRCX2_38145 [Paraclostridium sp.]